LCGCLITVSQYSHQVEEHTVTAVLLAILQK